MEEMGDLVSSPDAIQGPLGFRFTRRDGTEGQVSFFGAPTDAGMSLSQAYQGLRAMLEEARDNPAELDFVYEFSQVAEQMDAYLREHGDWPPGTPAESPAA